VTSPSWALGEARNVQAGGKIRIGIAAGPVDLDPHTTTLLGDQQLLENVYRGLTVLDPKTLSPVGEIAESWVVSSDELTWTFNLRPGVRFHNGRAVVADPEARSRIRSTEPVRSKPATARVNEQSNTQPLFPATLGCEPLGGVAERSNAAVSKIL